jgi:hypothetical protein
MTISTARRARCFSIRARARSWTLHSMDEASMRPAECCIAFLHADERQESRFAVPPCQTRPEQQSRPRVE